MSKSFNLCIKYILLVLAVKVFTERFRIKKIMYEIRLPKNFICIYALLLSGTGKNTDLVVGLYFVILHFPIYGLVYAHSNC